MIAPLSPTQLLLLRLARLEMTEEDRAIARWYAARSDLGELARLAIRGGIPGIVAASLEEVRLEGMPRAAGRELAFAALQTEAANRALLGETRALCGLAAERGLTLVPFKGMALYLGRPYRDLGSRSSVDVDLVAPRAELLEAERLILASGHLAKPGRRYFLRHHQHLGFSASRGGRAISVELHWTPFFLLFGTRASDQAALERLVEHEHEGARYRLFDLEDTLLALLLHLGNHRFAGQLKWLVDVAELIRFAGAGLDWEELWARADRLGGVGAAGLGLRLVDSLLGPIPIRWPRLGLRDLARIAAAGRLLPGAGFWSERPPSGGRGVLLDLLLRDRPGERLAHLVYKLAELYERGGREAPELLLRTDLARLS
jgi:hypothetical protein